MCWLYILTNIKGNYYIGSTNNLSKRIKQHRAGYTRTTRILKTYDLIYSEQFETLTQARNREKLLKSYKSKKYINWLINNQGSLA